MRRGILDVDNGDGKSLVGKLHFHRVVLQGEVQKLRSTKFSKSGEEHKHPL
jgi:hypothetical protein